MLNKTQTTKHDGNRNALDLFFLTSRKTRLEIKTINQHYYKCQWIVGCSKYWHPSKEAAYSGRKAGLAEREKRLAMYWNIGLYYGGRLEFKPFVPLQIYSGGRARYVTVKVHRSNGHCITAYPSDQTFRLTCFSPIWKARRQSRHSSNDPC